MKKWTRSRTNRMLAGVLGGMSERIGMNAKWLRLLFLAAVVMTGFFPMVFVYLVLIFLLPNEQRYIK